MAKSGRFEHRECKKCEKHKTDIFINEPDGYYCRACHQFIEEEKMEVAQILKLHDDPVEESEPLDSCNDPRRSGRSRKIIKKKAPSPDHFDADGNDSARSNEVPMKLLRMDSNEDKEKETRCSNQACAVDLVATDTRRRHPITKERVCSACGLYFKRTGMDRPEEIVRRSKESKLPDKEIAYKSCSNQACAVDLVVAADTRPHPITKERLCRICYEYLRKFGKERSEEMVRRSKESKQLDKEIVYKSCSNQACAVDLFATDTRRHPITKNPVCSACYLHFKRNGKERSEEKVRRSKEIKLLDKEIDYKRCSNQACAVDLIPYYSVRHPITRKRVCRACYFYFRKYGKERSEEIVRQSKESKLLDKEIAYTRDEMTSNELKEKETRCSNQACAVDLVATDTRPHPITKERVCRSCREYFRRNGKERSEEKYCSNQACAVDLIPYYSVRHPITRKRVCRACYHYVRTHGKDRSEEIVRQSKESKLPDKKIAYTSCSNQACAVDVVAADTRPHLITKERVCSACCSYFKRTGMDRSEEIVRRLKESKRLDKKVAHKRSNQDETPILQNAEEDLRPAMMNTEVDQSLPMKKVNLKPETEIFEESDSDDEDPMIFYKDFEDSDESGLSRESEKEESSSEDELEYLRPFRAPKNTREDDEDEYLPNFMQQSLL